MMPEAADGIDFLAKEVFNLLIDYKQFQESA